VKREEQDISREMILLVLTVFGVQIGRMVPYREN
jgi:hypothetical protein